MEIIDFKEKEVFKKDGRGVAILVDEPYLLVNQVCLEPTQEVPLHHANSNVTLQVVHGEGTFNIGDKVVKMGPGKLLRVPIKSAMSIKNESKEQMAFLVIKTPQPQAVEKEARKVEGEEGRFVNLINFPPLKDGSDKEFLEWFSQSSKVFSRHPGFISRTLLKSTEGTGRYAAIVEHDSQGTFMTMHLSEDREVLFRKVAPLLEGTAKPHFYEVAASYRK